MGLRSRDALLNRGKKSRGVAGGAGLGRGERLKPKDLNRQGSQSRVVAHLRNGQLLKGYASLLPQNDPDALLKDRSVALLHELTGLLLKGAPSSLLTIGHLSPTQALELYRQRGGTPCKKRSSTSKMGHPLPASGFV